MSEKRFRVMTIDCHSKGCECAREPNESLTDLYKQTVGDYGYNSKQAAIDHIEKEKNNLKKQRIIVEFDISDSGIIDGKGTVVYFEDMVKK